MNKNLLRVISIILIFLVLLMSFGSTYAITDPMSNPDAYKPSVEMPQKATLLASQIISGLRNVAIIISVISLMILGIKYMFGSVEEKADYKKTLIPITIGIIMISAIFTIVDIIYSAAVSSMG